MSRTTTLDALVPSFDGFLVDQFGVLLTANGAYPDAAESLNRLFENGGRIVLLSNSGKRAEPNIRRLLNLGFSRESFITVLSSGEVAYGVLKERIGADLPLRPKILLLSRDGDRSPIDGLNVELTEDARHADLVLIAASEADRIDFATIVESLRPAAESGIPAICSNPDMSMLSGEGTRPGAGAIAAAYQNQGGVVEFVGKPHPAVYRQALALLAPIDPQRILCIGDSPAHDIVGGRSAGLATALVRTGIHQVCSDEELEEIIAKENGRPDFLIPRFELSRL